MKIDTSTGWLGEPAAAWAMPSSKWRAPSIEAPYTDTHRAGGAQQEAAPVHPRARRQRHPRLDRGQPAAGHRDRRFPAAAAAAQQLRAVEVVAGAARPSQLTCMSGEVAISMRSAFWRIAR